MTELISANSQEPCQAGSPLPPHPTSEDPSLSATAQKRSESQFIVFVFSIKALFNSSSPDIVVSTGTPHTKPGSARSSSLRSHGRLYNRSIIHYGHTVNQYSLFINPLLNFHQLCHYVKEAHKTILEFKHNEDRMARAV